MVKVIEFLRGVMPCEMMALAECDLDDEVRKESLAKLMQAGVARGIGDGLYAAPRVDGIPAALAYGPLRPPPYELADAVCRRDGFRMAIPVEVAAWMMGAREKPTADSLAEFPFDGDEAVVAQGHSLVPVPRWSCIASLSVAGQAVALGVPSDLRKDMVGAIAKRAVAGIMGEPAMREMLSGDVYFLKGTFLAVAEAILKAPTPSSVPRSAPEGFEPPDGPVVTVHGWWVRTLSDGSENLAARSIEGHPDIADGDTLSRSSPLVWIDEGIGWAMTRSRLYRLARKEGVEKRGDGDV